MRSILGIDTGTRVGSIALAIDGAALDAIALHPGAHSSGLAVAAERLLATHGLKLAALAGVAVSEGPGSFTGLRIGLAWAKGIALGRHTPLALISAHEACAHSFRQEAGLIVTLLPGERGHVGLARWAGGSRASLLAGPEQVDEEALPAALNDPSLAPPAGSTLLIVAPGLSPELARALRRPGRSLRDPTALDAGARPGDEVPPMGAAIAELGDLAIREGRAADPIGASPAYGRAPNARKPAA
jgi:tRNA threonylcarbamoyladenosine biosynthesis protein TsaB